MLWASARPILYVALGLSLLLVLWYLLATAGPNPIKDPIRVEAPVVDDAEFKRQVAEVEALEARYASYAAADVVSDEALGVLTEAVNKQRALARSPRFGDYIQQRNLERLESELDGVRARSGVTRLVQLMEDAEAHVEGARLPEAIAAFTEALGIQRGINTGNAPSRFKNYVREAEIERSLLSLQVFPLHFEKEEALKKARLAMEQERWSDALAAYTAARDALDKINREFPTTRYVDLAGFDRISGEIDSLNAVAIARELDAFEQEGDLSDRVGDFPAAVTAYAEALLRQKQVNQLFPRSRFMSSARIETLETKLQTSRSRPLAAELAELETGISANLRGRSVAAAEQLVPRAMELTKRLAEDFPRSRFVDGAVRIKLSYISLKRDDLKRIQEDCFDRLLPLIAVNDRLLLGSEVPQFLYEAVMNTNPSRNPGRALPVDSVNWNDAVEFCTRLGWILGTTVRLPTTDEYRTALGEGGGGIRSSADGGLAGATDSGRPNPNGYRDLLGNLAEWLAAAGDAERAVIAGGSYLDTPEALSKIPMETRLKVDRARHIGFRFVVELPENR